MNQPCKLTCGVSSLVLLPTRLLFSSSALFGSVSSLASIVGAPAMVDYAASKSAARSFAEALSLEMKNLKKTGVRVTCVCPSHINTGLFQGFR